MSCYSYFKFRGNVRLTEITPANFHQYESWMFGQDFSKTTVGIYSRQSRKGEIVMYQTADGQTTIEVKVENETVWLRQERIAGLFARIVLW